MKATKQRISLWWCQIQKFSRFTHENQTEFTKRGLLKNSPENMLNRSTKSWKQRKQVVFILDMVLDNRAQVHPILLIWVTDEDQICSKIQKSVNSLLKVFLFGDLAFFGFLLIVWRFNIVSYQPSAMKKKNTDTNTTKHTPTHSQQASQLMCIGTN